MNKLFRRDIEMVETFREEVRNPSLDYTSPCHDVNCPTMWASSIQHPRPWWNLFSRVDWRNERNEIVRGVNWFDRHAETNHAEFIRRGKLFAPKRPRAAGFIRTITPAEQNCPINRPDIRGANKFYTRLESMWTSRRTRNNRGKAHQLLVTVRIRA